MTTMFANAAMVPANITVCDYVCVLYMRVPVNKTAQINPGAQYTHSTPTPPTHTCTYTYKYIYMYTYTYTYVYVHITYV